MLSGCLGQVDFPAGQPSNFSFSLAPWARDQKSHLLTEALKELLVPRLSWNSSFFQALSKKNLPKPKTEAHNAYQGAVIGKSYKFCKY